MRWLKRLALALALFVGVGLLALGVFVAANWQDARRFPKIISAYYAKEACTCLYVLQRNEAACHEMVRQYVPISSFQRDDRAGTISVRGLGRRSVAAYLGPRRGCRLVE